MSVDSLSRRRGGDILPLVIFRCLCVVVCSIIFIETRAQGFHGRIMAGDSVPLAYATVYIPALRAGVMTDGEGQYAIRSLPAGPYAVEFSSLGYRTVRDTIAVADGAEVERDVHMEELAYTLREVIVTSGDANPALAALRKMRDNAPSYYGQIAAYEAEVVNSYEQNLKKIPKSSRRVIKVLASLTGMRKIFNLFLNHPDLAFSVGYTATFDGMTYAATDERIIKCNERLTAKEQKVVLEIGGGTGNLISSVSNNNLPWSEEQEDNYHFTWDGSYEENGHIINVVNIAAVDTTYGGVGTVHIIEDLDCILKMDLISFVGRSSMECKEVAPGLYLPVSFLGEIKFSFPDEDSGSMKVDVRMQGGNSVQYKSIATR